MKMRRRKFGYRLFSKRVGFCPFVLDVRGGIEAFTAVSEDEVPLFCLSFMLNRKIQHVLQ